MTSSSTSSEDGSPFASTPEALKWRNQAVQVLLRRHFPQNGWMWPSLFVQMARKRLSRVSLGVTELEKWDKMGVFHPLIRTHYPVSLHRKRSDRFYDWEKEPFEGNPDGADDLISIIHNGWAPEDSLRPVGSGVTPGVVEVATRENYLSWDEYTAKGEAGDRTSLGGVLYHPFQLFRLERAVQAALHSCTYVDFHAGEKTRSHIQDDLDDDRRRLVECEASDLKTLYLLALIEDRYLPHWRGERGRILVKGAHDDEGNSWHDFREKFDAAQVLAASGLSVEDAHAIRKGLAWRGRCMDPNKSLYLFLRHLSYGQRERLEGEALLAWDYYGAAEMIGWFLRDVTGEKQEATDDLNHSTGWWKKDRYGVDAKDIDFDLGNILRPLLQELVVDPVYKLLLVVEGESEEEFIRTWCHQQNVHLEHEGVRVLIADGVQGLKNKAMRQILREAKTQGAGVVVVLDDEGQGKKKAKPILEGLVAKKLLMRIFEVEEMSDGSNPTGGMMWSPCFEDANFSLDQLLGAWREAIRKSVQARGRGEVPDEAVLRAAVEQEKSLLGEKGTWIAAMAEARGRLNVPLDKPQLAACLARLCVETNADVPIVRLIDHCRHLAHLVNHYGPPHPKGGFGLSDEEEEQPSPNQTS